MDKGHFLTPNSLPSTDFRPMIRGRDCLDPRAEAQSIAIEERLGLDEDSCNIGLFGILGGTTIVHRTRFDLSTSDWFRADCGAEGRDPGKPAVSQYAWRFPRAISM